MAALVGYSDSEDDEITIKQPTKRKSLHETSSELPALPDEFLDLYVAPVRTSTVDDPTLHAGRQRSNVHVQGNWPSHIYIDWRPSDDEASWLKSIATSLHKLSSKQPDDFQIRSLLEDDTGTDLPLHISLSRSLGLRTDQRDSFLIELEKTIQETDIKAFPVTLSELKWESNFERNRWFLIATTRSSAAKGLNLLLHLCNQLAAEFQQPPLYTEDEEPSAYSRSSRTNHKRPKRGDQQDRKHVSVKDQIPDKERYFHVSIAWSLQEPSSEVIQCTRDLFNSRTVEPKFWVRSLKAKVGNSIETIPFEKKVSHEKSLLG